MLRALIANLTSLALALHVVLGCCWHHAHQCDCPPSDAAADPLAGHLAVDDGSVPDVATDGDDCADVWHHGGPGHLPGHDHCQGPHCVVAATVATPAMVPAASTALPALAAATTVAGRHLLRQRSLGNGVAPPERDGALRCHLLYQVLLI